ncbi:hypothetical protein Spith_1382 [Spirochaeta thermophila DSM 6578]|uniref:Uncharacterized protein n=2 Tax=Winmispira thermophila TaxID=154 RepID=G0GFV3_WINT7|nr:hypothetical protein Spith_1382 [Spirochaeta thermophila DSM 6578]
MCSNGHMMLFALVSMPLFLIFLVTILGLVPESKEGLYRFLRGLVWAVPFAVLYVLVMQGTGPAYEGLWLYVREGVLGLGLPFLALLLAGEIFGSRWGEGLERYGRFLWFSGGFLLAFQVLDLLLHVRWMGAYTLFSHPLLFSLFLYMAPRMYTEWGKTGKRLRIWGYWIHGVVVVLATALVPFFYYSNFPVVTLVVLVLVGGSVAVSGVFLPSLISWVEGRVGGGKEEAHRV